MTLEETIDSEGEALSLPMPAAPSPFLPGTNIQFAWDSTSIGLLKTCPRLYQLSMLEGWSSRGDSVHLRFGIEVHLALQAYDMSRANGIGHEDAVFDVVKDLYERTYDWNPEPNPSNPRDPVKYKNRSTLVSLVIDYLDSHIDDPAETYIMANGKPAVELSFQFELDWGPEDQPLWEKTYSSEENKARGIPSGSVNLKSQPYLLCGHLDKVVTFNSALLIKDYKTTITTPSQYYFAQYEPHNQMTLYTLAGKVVLGTPVRGVCIDAMQVCLDQPHHFVRGFTYRTPDQLDEWLNDLALLLRLNETYAAANYWPMNDTACDKFGGCKFRSICSNSPSVRDRFLRADFTQLPESERWNPLKVRG